MSPYQTKKLIAQCTVQSTVLILICLITQPAYFHAKSRDKRRASAGGGFVTGLPVAFFTTGQICFLNLAKRGHILFRKWPKKDSFKIIENFVVS